MSHKCDGPANLNTRTEQNSSRLERNRRMQNVLDERDTGTLKIPEPSRPERASPFGR